MSNRVSSESTNHRGDEAKDWLDNLMDVTAKREVIIQGYGQTSKQYEQNMSALNYNGAHETGLALAKLFPSNKENIHILDIAAGTGLCAVEFRKHGFRKMDALEPSDSMIEEAKKRGLYNNYIKAILADNTLDIKDDTYDVVTMSSFCTDIMRQLPMKSLEEIVRIVKPGGYVINTGFYTTFVGEQESTADFRQKLKSLEKEGKWKLVEIKHFVEYLDGRDGGVSIHVIC